MSVCPLDPDSSDFGDVCALYAPFLHQLTMQSFLFERGCPTLVVVCVARKLRPCPSYSRRRDRINLGLWRSLYKGGAGYHFPDHVGYHSGHASHHVNENPQICDNPDNVCMYVTSAWCNRWCSPVLKHGYSYVQLCIHGHDTSTAAHVPTLCR